MSEVSAVSAEVEKKPHHLMIDLETLGKTYDSVILSIGAVAFDMNGDIGSEFERFPTVDDQMVNRKISWSTIQWWMNQEQSVRMSIANAHRTSSLKECLVDLYNFCQNNLQENFKVWSNGISFDIAILNHAYYQYGLETPWSYKNQLDCRTICWLSKISTKNYESSGIKHSAIDDCKWQISWTVDAFTILKEY